MDVSIWWVLAAASAGLFAGIGLFAVLTMASHHEDEYFSDRQAPTRS